MKISNRYIQVGTEPAKNIYTEWGIYATKVEGLNQLPDTKDKWSRDWPDEQGEDVYYPSIVRFKGKEITVTFRIDEPGSTAVMNAISSFRNYLFLAGDLSYFDTYRKNGFRGYYNKEKTKEEKYRTDGSYVEFELNFFAPNGICFGFDNTGRQSIYVDVDQGTCDLYFSDGGQMQDVSENISYLIDEGFVIVCPSVYNGVSVISNEGFIFGVQDTGSDYLFGVQYSGTDYLFGV